MQNNHDELREKAYTAIQRSFPCEDSLLQKDFLDEAIKHYGSSLIPSQKPFFIRLTGQSGCGKSTQLAPSVQEALQNRSYVHLSVGKFAIFHPEYEKFTHEIPDMAREKTNGFGLRLMLIFLEYCLKNNINVVLEFSLIDADFEIYLLSLVKAKKYRMNMHLMCVPQQVSNKLIRRRQEETNRCVTPKTASYTYDIVPKSLEKILQFPDIQENDRIVLWSLCFAEPILCTIFSDKSILGLLQKYRSPEYATLGNPDELLRTRKIWMKDFLKDF